jgi:23S rRNA (cytosine1962-C5)-methyltransferase
MAIPSLILKRNLRKSLMQGNPWIYKDNLVIPKEAQETSLCKLKDQKNEFLGWGMYSPQSPLAFRLLTLDKNPPNPKYYEGLLTTALNLRSRIINDNTNAYRLINGEGDLMPGFICDVYGSVAVFQFDGQSMYEFWDQDFLAAWVLENTKCTTVYFKPRHDSKLKSKFWGEELTSNFVQCRENGCEFLVDIVDGQKTGFFLDQRENRNYLGQMATQKSVLNLFSYSGGFSVYAGLNHAQKVTSVDIAQGALDLSQKIWALNKIQAQHNTVCADVFEYLNQDTEKFDIVICDPPSLAKSESQKELAMNKYIDTFALAAKKVKAGGHLVLSSCSSHISFNDFEIITNEALSKSRKRGQTLRFSGQGADHPYPQACPHLRYLKFIDLVIY